MVCRSSCRRFRAATKEGCSRTGKLRFGALFEAGCAVGCCCLMRGCRHVSGEDVWPSAPYTCARSSLALASAQAAHCWRCWCTTCFLLADGKHALPPVGVSAAFTDAHYLDWHALAGFMHHPHAFAFCLDQLDAAGRHIIGSSCWSCSGPVVIRRVSDCSRLVRSLARVE